MEPFSPQQTFEQAHCAQPSLRHDCASTEHGSPGCGQPNASPTSIAHNLIITP